MISQSSRSPGSPLQALALLVLLAAPAARLAAADVDLRFYDRSGAPLSAAAARSLMTNAGAGWANDALIDPRTLQDLVEQPLRNGSAGLSFTLPAAPVALALNWPTTRGYSLLIVDHDGAGFSAAETVNFTDQAARDVKRRLDLALAARPTYQRSPAFQAAYATAQACLASAASAASDSVRGQQGYLALDALAEANDLLLAEYGPAFAGSNLATQRPWIGFTLDTTAGYQAVLTAVKGIGGADTWIRVVCDSGTAPASYSAVVAAAKAQGIHVMLQPMDSSAVKGFTRAASLARIKQFVDAFPQVDAWEVGNEVNGSWLGSGVGDKIADAAAYVRATRPAAQVVLTLYWQVGTDAPQWSMFNWLRANVPAATRADLDAVLVSLYVEDAPMGLAFDEMMQVLRSEFPSQRLGLGELGYWNSDTSKAWWAFDATDTAGARRRLAAQYYAGALGYPNSVGGGFWWYAAEEMTTDAALAAAVRQVVARIQPAHSGAPLITAQPRDAAVTVGQSATFAVGASGSPAPTYQWQRDGVAIPGATAASFTTAATTAGDDGAQYRVVVANALGETLSAPARLSVAALPPPPPVATGSGLTAQYWTKHNRSFAGQPTLTRVDATVDFDWGAGSPDPVISANHFTARWSGQLQAPTTETYTVSVTADDGVRLWIDGVLLIDGWKNQSATEYSAQVAFASGRLYAITLEYYEATGAAMAKLAWSSPSSAKATIPRARLFPATPVQDGLPRALGRRESAPARALLGADLSAPVPSVLVCSAQGEPPPLAVVAWSAQAAGVDR